MTTAIIIKLPGVSSEVSLASEWLHDRDLLIQAAGDVQAVDGKESFEIAAEVMRRITKHSNALEAHRKELGKPFREADSIIKKTADKAREALETEKNRLQRLCSVYAQEQARLQDEEQRRIEAQRRADVEKQLAANQAAIKAGLLDEEDVQIHEQPAPGPVVVQAKAAGVAVKSRVVWIITDESQIPEMFKTFDQVKLNGWLKMNEDRVRPAIEDDPEAGAKFVPGIKFAMETKVTASR